MNPAQQRTVTVSGAQGDLTAALDGKLVNVTIDQATHIVTVTATQATGTDTLHLVDAAGARADVPIRVAFNAGTIVPQATLKVTGNPADPAWLVAQVQALVARLTSSLPGAQTTIAPVQPLATPLAPGQQAQITVPVQISGGGQYFDQSGTTSVSVQNLPAGQYLPAALVYDDDPEHLMQDGVIYRGTISSAQGVRLYYYHENGNDPRHFYVALSTAVNDPASVQVTNSSAGPNIDVMSVGHAVTKNFLLMKPLDEGVILDLQPGAFTPIVDTSVGAREGIAGTIDFHVLNGGPVAVTILAASPGTDPQTLLSQPVLPGDGHHRRGTFALASFGNDALTYSAGGPDAKLVYADRAASPPNAEPGNNGTDFGDYGVMHTIVFTLENPTDTASNAYLYERPLGGGVRSSFLVDGRLVELGCAREPVPYQIAAYSLQPRQTYHLVVQTMTDGGSSYPIEVGVTSTPPQPGTPSISAPDGCFPKHQ